MDNFIFITRADSCSMSDLNNTITDNNIDIFMNDDTISTILLNHHLIFSVNNFELMDRRIGNSYEISFVEVLNTITFRFNNFFRYNLFINSVLQVYNPRFNLLNK